MSGYGRLKVKVSDLERENAELRAHPFVQALDRAEVLLAQRSEQLAELAAENAQLRRNVVELARKIVALEDEIALVSK